MRQQVAQVRASGAAERRRQPQHLVEIAVVEPSLPIDAEQRAAHHGVQVGGHAGVLEQLQVGSEPALADEGAAEALDRHVGEHEEVAELDAEVRAQLAPVVGLQRRLRRRQHRPLRVVDQVERQAGARAPVAAGVELPQRGDALVEHAVAALAVDVGHRVARQRGRHVDAVQGQKVGQILLAGFEQHGEVAAVDHAHAEGACRSRQPAEVGVQLGRAAGDVERGDAARGQHLQHQVDGVGVHRFGARRPGVHMAVQAALVAAVAEIDLQGVEAAPAQRREIGVGEKGQGGVHGGFLQSVTGCGSSDTALFYTAGTRPASRRRAASAKCRPSASKAPKASTPASMTASASAR